MVRIAAVPGLEKTSDAFRRALVATAQKLGMQADHLAAIIAFETGGTFSPTILNAAGSGAVGLIQFMPETARALLGLPKGFEKEAAARVRSMSAIEQLSLVEKYFRPFVGRLGTLESAYLAVLWPAGVGKDPSTVLFSKGGAAYRQNAGLDADKNQQITAAEAAAGPRGMLARAGGKFVEVVGAAASGAGPLSPSPLPPASGGTSSADVAATETAPAVVPIIERPTVPDAVPAFSAAPAPSIAGFFVWLFSLVIKLFSRGPK